MKRITNFSITIDNNLQEYYDVYNQKLYVVSPFQIRKCVIEYDDGTTEEETSIIDRTICEEMKDKK